MFEIKNVIIFLAVSLNMCYGSLKEPSHRDSSFEYQQHMFGLEIREFIFNYTLISGSLYITRIVSKSVDREG